MAMTKKDYDLVAKSLAAQRIRLETRKGVELATLDETIESMAAHFALIYDNFKKDAFMEAARHGQDSND